ncbi:hypothetical protein HN51_011575 [Arachis hypogaea]
MQVDLASALSFLVVLSLTLSEENASVSSNEVKPFSKCLNEVEKIISYAPESKGDGNINGNYLDSLLEDFRTRVNISCSNDMRPREIRLVMSGYLPSVMSQSDLVGFGIFQNFQILQSICLKYTISRCEFSAEKFETTAGHKESSVFDSCSVNQDHSNALKLELGLSSPVVSSEVGISQPKEEHEVDELSDADWSNLTEVQLEELLLSNLDTIFKSAIKNIVASGYTEEVAKNPS